MEVTCDIIKRKNIKYPDLILKQITNLDITQCITNNLSATEFLTIISNKYLSIFNTVAKQFFDSHDLVYALLCAYYISSYSISYFYSPVSCYS